MVQKYLRLKWKKKVNIITTIIIEYTWIGLNQQASEYVSSLKHAKMGKLLKFQGSQFAGATPCFKYARICLDKISNISRVLNIPEF